MDEELRKFQLELLLLGFTKIVSSPKGKVISWVYPAIKHYLYKIRIWESHITSETVETAISVNGELYVIDEDSIFHLHIIMMDMIRGVHKYNE